MLARITSVPAFIAFLAMALPGLNTVLAQSSIAEFPKILKEAAIFEQTDRAALEQGQPVVKLLPVQDKREVAVCGLVSLQVPAEVFLQSFRDSMVRKSNAAILEIGRFNSTPSLDDLQALTIEDRDIDDLKDCVVGDCKLKLSTTMIERFQKEINWEAPDYRVQVTQLFKRILFDYVRDYLSQGETALIEYVDKPKEVRLAEEQRSLMAAANSFIDVARELPPDSKGYRGSVVENAIVWSKIKFGLKPVIAINHISIYKRDQMTGPQILIVSKQIYANHYFDSSLALTAFGNTPGASPGSYLFYENRSRVDGLTGIFGKIKRDVVENQAVDSLKTILEKSKVTLTARAFNQTESAPAANVGRFWRRWTIGVIQVFFWVFVISALVALLRLGNFEWKSG